MEMAAFANDETDFIFSLSENTAIGAIAENHQMGWVATPVINGKPRQDQAGLIAEKIQIKGETLGITDGSTLAELMTLLNAGKPVTYVEAGNHRGQWVIKQVSKNKTEIMPNGATQKVEFTVTIEEYQNA